MPLTVDAVPLSEDSRRVGEGGRGDSASGDMFEAVHARLLTGFPELVAELGGSAIGLLRRASIGIGGDGDSVTYRQFIALMELAATELRCPDFGMRLARRQSGGSMFGPLGEAMRNSATFGDALAYVGAHSYAHSLAARVWQKRRQQDGAVFSGHDILLDRVPVKSQAMEHLLLVGHLAALEITGGKARARRVYFRHEPVSPPGVYRRAFGCEVRFGQHDNGVLFFEADLAAPVIAPDASAYRRITALIDARFTRHRPPLHAEARGIIMRLLGTDRCTNDEVASELSLHARTLHRRLRAEGTSFQNIKDEVRRDAMLYYVWQTDLEFAVISEKLGFAEQSVMTRSCNRWFGASPTRLRAERAG